MSRTPSAGQLTVPDYLNPKNENPAYAAGWNDCRQEMLKWEKPAHLQEGNWVGTVIDSGNGYKVIGFSVDKLTDIPVGTRCYTTPPAQPAPVQEPVAWQHTDRLGGVQVFTKEQPPGLKKKCRPLIFGDTTPPAAPVQEPESFEQWNAKQHGDPEEIGFLQALRIAYCSGQDSVTKTAAQPAPVQEPVAIYQYQMGDGSWIDQEKHSYDYNVRHGQATVRIVYTTPPAGEKQ